MKRSTLFIGLALAAFAALLLFVPELVLARPGGGQTFGGGGSGGGGGGDGDGGLIYLLIWLIIEYPYIGIPLAIVVAIVYFRKGKNGSKAQNESWDSAPPRPPGALAPMSMQALRATDPDFSRVLFEDFVFKLYAKAHRSRHDHEALEALAPYLSDGVRQVLRSRSSGAQVQGVVIGAMSVVRFGIPDEFARVHLAFTSNLTEGNRTHFIKEVWVMRRAKTAKSRGPDEVESLHCPSCGAPFESSDNVHCSHCENAVTDGQFDWIVEAAMLTDKQSRPPTLAGHAPEHGTLNPTIIHPGYPAARASLQADDPQVTDQLIAARLVSIYTVLNDAWSNRNLAPARPFVSDSLYHYLGYWISAYRRQQLRNELKDMRILKWQPVKLIRDKHFDALTLRVWGTGKDSTVHIPTKRVVGGSPNIDRRYTEYWTLIRGAAARGAPRADKNCPNCGAPMKVNMAGACEFCNAHLTRGEFDWVLSKIEQDEVYRG